MVVPVGIEPTTRGFSVHCSTNWATEPWLRGKDLNQRPPGYEPDELPDCSTPRYLNFAHHDYIINNLAEEVGFEPTHALTSAGFQDQSLQPLGYSSIMVDPVGLEPTTNRLWAGSSDQLS